jgi:hypothetical protein
MYIISSLTTKHVIGPNNQITEREREKLIQRKLIFHCMKAPSGLELPYWRRFTTTLRQTTVGRKPLEERSARRTELNWRTHNNHMTHTHLCPGGIGNRNPSKRAAANPRLSPRSHWVNNGRYKKALQLKYKTSASKLLELYMLQWTLRTARMT